jgi:hypothetical protein
MCAEASTVLRAVAADFVFNCWYLEIPSDNCIRRIPRRVHCHGLSELPLNDIEPPLQGVKKNIVGLERLCGLVVRVLRYRSGGPGSIPAITRKKK